MPSARAGQAWVGGDSGLRLSLGLTWREVLSPGVHVGFTPKAWALPCSMCVCWSGHSGSLAAPRAVTLAGPAFPWAAGGGGRLFLGPVPSLPTLDSHTAGRRWAPGNTRQAPHLVPVDLSPCL